MNVDKKVILHITFDGVLFDQVYPQFEAMERYENRYLLGAIGSSKKLKFIKNSEKIIRADNLDEWGKFISDPQVDIIYLHGLWKDYLKAVDFIQDNVKVMWWCYGMEIYENVFGQPALMGLNIYKPKTLRFYLSTGPFYIRISHKLLFYCPKLYVLIRGFFNAIFRRPERKLKKMLSRIDFAFTPLKMELDVLKKRHPYIKGKPYRFVGVANKDVMERHSQMGHLLFEHSAHISNNHLDVLDSIKEKQLDFKGRNIYVPLSYGVKKMAERVKEESKFEGANVCCLMEPLPYQEYSEMISSCSHAIFGMIRQSGLGNIYLCFRKGIKVFLFKDSILFKQLKNDGYYVYSIEDDLNEESIKTPLAMEQADHNYNLFYEQFGGSVESFEQQFDRILNS
jgi:hypothetical protein